MTGVAGTIGLYDVDVGVQLRFQIVLNNVRQDLTVPPPQSITLLVNTGAGGILQFPLTVDPLDHTSATYTVKANDFPVPGMFVSQLQLTYNSTNIFNSDPFNIRIKAPFTP